MFNVDKILPSNGLFTIRSLRRCLRFRFSFSLAYAASFGSQDIL